MAGRGPAPRDPARRARRNSDPTPGTVLRFVSCEQPPLPEGFPWPAATIEWWAAWARSPYSEHIDEMGWHFLLDTALLHAAVHGNYELDRLPELRLRVCQFGITLEARARLRITFAEADEADAGAGKTGRAAPRDRYRDLRVVHDTG